MLVMFKKKATDAMMTVTVRELAHEGKGTLTFTTKEGDEEVVTRQPLKSIRVPIGGLWHPLPKSLARDDKRVWFTIKID